MEWAALINNHAACKILIERYDLRQKIKGMQKVQSITGYNTWNTQKIKPE